MTADVGDPLCQLPTMSMKSLIHCTLPSAMQTLTPLGCQLLHSDWFMGRDSWGFRCSSNSSPSFAFLNVDRDGNVPAGGDVVAAALASWARCRRPCKSRPPKANWNRRTSPKSPADRT